MKSNINSLTRYHGSWWIKVAQYKPCNMISWTPHKSGILLGYTLPAKIWNIWKVRRKHSHSTFWWTKNSKAPTTNKYCDFNATLTCSVLDEKYNFQYSKLKIHNKLYSNVSFLLRCLTCPGYPSLHWESWKILCVFNDWLQNWQPVTGKQFAC